MYTHICTKVEKVEKGGVSGVSYVDLVGQQIEDLLGGGGQQEPAVLGQVGCSQGLVEALQQGLECGWFLLEALQPQVLQVKLQLVQGHVGHPRCQPVVEGGPSVALTRENSPVNTTTDTSSQSGEQRFTKVQRSSMTKSPCGHFKMEDRLVLIKAVSTCTVNNTHAVRCHVELAAFTPNIAYKVNRKMSRFIASSVTACGMFPVKKWLNLVLVSTLA